MAGSQMYVRMDQGSTGAVGPEDEQSICAGLKSILATADAVIVSDYSYGVMTPEVIEQLAKLRSAAPLLLVESRPSGKVVRRSWRRARKPSCA
jgi:D-beta-D-heptose 7-phosphate kinase / D-beta-D-heptose 1-phosphate adenosyltransferase